MEYPKPCGYCEGLRPAAKFRRRPNGTLAANCRDCESALNKKWRTEHPEKAAAMWKRTRAKRFGMSEAQLDALLAGGKCEACAAVMENGKRSHHIDHDHVTGRVRGLLCAGCNTSLGLLKEDPARIRALAAYIERTGA